MLLQLVQDVAQLLSSCWDSLWCLAVELLSKLWKLAEEGLMLMLLQILSLLYFAILLSLL